MKIRRLVPTVAIAMATTLTLAACGDDSPTADGGSEDTAAEEESAESGSDEAAGGELSGDVLASGAPRRRRP
ncbi:hypothetical protein [Ornithinimicrobium sp. CNJ-824]|uniref:hypothetical protein n=1 Tax=Ornithinimicrobium sp. CNJ-824 TaxID=1904966 RepID=UPI001EDBD370|nr:hypothetical protein [Ornithinimicrobium sp. CNJ-824]